MKLVHITLYPPKSEKHIKASGVASYSKNLITNMDDPSVDHTVICNVINQKEIYKEGKVTVRRVFRRRPGFLKAVHRELKEINPDVIHIQQELALFGNVITAYLLQWLVLAWRAKMVITLHGVVDPRTIDKVFVKENNSRLPVWLVRLAFRIIYTPLMKWPRKVIVHEQHFKDIAVNSYGATPNKITVIPHGVEMFTAVNQAEARDALGLPQDAEIVLFMGYATGYKGLDLLIDGFADYVQTHPKAYLILGAGKHPKLQNDPKYEREYARLKTKAATLLSPQQYTWEGFIKESEITAYYSASDLSVYPYTTALSSSGPMAFAIGYDKPFLASTAFENIFSEYPQLLFERRPQDLSKRLAYFFSHRDEYESVSSVLRQERNWAHVGEKTLQLYSESEEEIYETEKSVTTG